MTFDPVAGFSTPTTTSGRYAYGFKTGSSSISYIDLEVPANLKIDSTTVRAYYSLASTQPSISSTSGWTQASLEIIAPGTGDYGTKLGTGDKRYWILKVNAPNKTFSPDFWILFDITNQPASLTTSPQVMLLKSGNGSVWDSGTISAPTLAAPPVTAAISADSVSLVAGQSTTLRWNTSNATTAILSPGDQKVNLTGSLSISPTTTTTYTIVADGLGGTDTASVTVNVVPQPPIVTISASPKHITYDNCTSITYSATGDISSVVIVPIGTVSGGSNIQKQVCNLKTTTTFTITATGGGGSASASDTVTVDAPLAPVFTQPFTGPGTVNYNENAVLTWGVANATSVSITPFPDGKVTGSSAEVLNLKNTTTYTIVADGPGGATTEQWTINVRPKPPVFTISAASITAGKQTLLAGECTNLFWSSSTDPIPATITSQVISPQMGPVTTIGSGSPGTTMICPDNTTKYTIKDGSGTYTENVIVTVESPPSPAILIAQQTIDKKDTSGNVIARLTFYFVNNTPVCSCSTPPEGSIRSYPCDLPALPEGCSKAFEEPLLVCIPFPGVSKVYLENTCTTSNTGNCTVVPVTPCTDPSGLCYARCDNMTYVTRATDLEVGPHSCTCTTSTSYKYSTVTKTYVPVPVTTCTGTPCP